MPNVLPTIPNNPPQGIQALLDKVYLWNPDVSNELIEKINALMAKLGDAIGVIRPYNEIVAPINQYEPCYYGDGVYVAKNYLAERAEEFNEEDWILIARKEITADEININFAGQEDTVQSAVDTLKTDQDDLGDQVSSIESKIPADASESNQLVTKNEVLALPTFTYKVVNELPETGEEKTIYLVPKPGEGNDVHDEYIWANGAYELIGTTAVDLSGYLPLSGGTLTGDISFGGTSAWFNKIVFWDAPGAKPIVICAANEEINSSRTPHGIAFNFQTEAGMYPLYDTYYQLGRSDKRWKNIYTVKLNNGADLAVPTEGGTLARVEDIDAIGGDGTTGQVLTKTDTGMEWQDASGGGSLPDQTDNAGKFLTTDGTTASWGEALVNRATGPYALAVGEYAQATDIYSTAFGPNSVARGVWTTALGRAASATAKGSTAVGYKAVTTAERAIQLGYGTNSDANTFKVANENGNFEMMDTNGKVPLDRLTYVTDQIGDISTALTAILGE